MKFEQVNTAPPKGIKIKHHDADKAKVAFRASTGIGYRAGNILGGVIASAIFIGGTIATFATGNFLFFVLSVPVAVATGYAFMAITRSTVSIQVTPEAVTMNGKHYDRKLWGGFRHGHEITYTHQNKQRSTQKKFGKLNFNYGGQTQETAWMVDHVRSTNYVNWLNDLIASIGRPPEPEHAPTSGTRKQQF